MIANVFLLGMKSRTNANIASTSSLGDTVLIWAVFDTKGTSTKDTARFRKYIWYKSLYCDILIKEKYEKNAETSEILHGKQAVGQKLNKYHANSL